MIESFEFWKRKFNAGFRIHYLYCCCRFSEMSWINKLGQHQILSWPQTKVVLPGTRKLTQQKYLTIYLTNICVGVEKWNPPISIFIHPRKSITKVKNNKQRYFASKRQCEYYRVMKEKCFGTIVCITIPQTHICVARKILNTRKGTMYVCASISLKARYRGSLVSKKYTVCIGS